MHSNDISLCFRHFLRYAPALSIMLFLTINGWGQVSADKEQKIDALLNSYVQNKQYNGNVLVVQKGKVVYTRSYGLADFELNISNQRQTKFKIGSITKQFTALLILQLKEKGLLSLDSNINNYLPWYEHNAGRKVTIRNLLSHSSGLSNYTERPDFYNQMALLNISPKDFAAKYCQDSVLLFEPGTKFHYCNTDYYILGLIIESLTQKPYADVLRENILNKLGMRHTGIDSFASIIPNRAKGYNFNDEGFVNAGPINMSTSTYAAGAMYSTVDDLLLWQKALEGSSLLAEENKKLFFTPVINNHAFGLYINKLKNGKTVMGHPGGINGFSSFLVHFVDDDITIVLLDNITSHKRVNLDNISFGIYSILMDLPYEIPKKPLTLVLTESYLSKGPKPMLQEYEKLKKDSTYDLVRSTTFLNDFGYSLLTKGKVKESLIILKQATEEFPESANTLDSYAEALKADGQFKLALEYYRRILVLEPNNKIAQKEIQELQKIVN